MKITIDLKDNTLIMEGPSGQSFEKLNNTDEILASLKKYFEDTKIAERDSVV